MMGLFGYSFAGLTPAQVQTRREALDFHALAAQVSILAIVAAIQIYHGASWVSRRFGEGDEESRPSSPYLKAELENEKLGVKSKARILSAKIRWWMGDDIGGGWGTKGEWVLGGIWLGWLLILCFRDTGNGTNCG